VEVEESDGEWLIWFTPKEPAGPGSGWLVKISQTTGEVSLCWNE